MAQAADGGPVRVAVEIGALRERMDMPFPAGRSSSGSTGKPRRVSESSKPAPGFPAPKLSDVKDQPDCGVCGGYGYVSRDRPVGDPDFGKLHPCPACGHLAVEERNRTVYAAKQKRIAAYTVTRPEQTFETFDARNVSPSIRAAYHAALRFAGAPRGWLVLHGPPGTGKTQPDEYPYS
jgi:chromosomal replication initiation ATPase DnaA